MNEKAGKNTNLKTPEFIEKADNGGQIYPPIITDKDLGHGLHEQTTARGITRRDWLAGLAMQAMLSSTSEDAENAAQEFLAISVLAYRMADAMIAEGRKGE